MILNILNMIINIHKHDHKHPKHDPKHPKHDPIILNMILNILNRSIILNMIQSS